MMTGKQVVETLAQGPGRLSKVTWESVVPTLKTAEVSGTVTKRTIAHVVAGVDLANRREVREAIESGERGPLGALPYGSWVLFPYLIGHTNKAGQYNEYVRLYPPTEGQANMFHLTTETQFLIDGQPITREQAIAYCGAKAEAREERPLCFNVNVANIQTIE